MAYYIICTSCTGYVISNGHLMIIFLAYFCLTVESANGWVMSKAVQ